MPFRIRAPFAALLVVSGVFGATVTSPTPVRAVAPKVVVIVGPVGSLTTNYRTRGNEVAAAATAAGATVVKVYSPNATWANVRAAVAGANVIVYFGHGNGFPNPYSNTENTDRVNGWGLNRTTTGGDGDNWSTTMVYCGEKALLGTLSGSDGAAQRTYCGYPNNDGISPAPGFIMVYGQAHYTPGFGERYDEDDPLTTLAEAQQRVRHYSTPVFLRGGAAFYASAYGDADEIVARVLTQPTTNFGDIFRAGDGYSPSTLTTMVHPDFSATGIWVQRTIIAGLHFGDPDYWYAFAGNPARTPGGSIVFPPVVTARYPGPNSTNAGTGVVVTATFDRAVTGVSGSSFTLRDVWGTAIAATVSYNAYWKRAELRPTAPLAAGTIYTTSLTSAIHSTDGGTLAATSWSFTTAGTPGGAGDENYVPQVRLTFQQGTHTGYRFNAAGGMTAERTVSLATDSGANTSMRRTIANQAGRWFYITNGAWAGYWIRESAGVALPDGESAASQPDATYDPPRRVEFLMGTHTGYRFDAAGNVTAVRSVTLANTSGANASSLRQLDGEYGSWFSIVNGAWAGYWVRQSAVVDLDG